MTFSNPQRSSDMRYGLSSNILHMMILLVQTFFMNDDLKNQIAKYIHVPVLSPFGIFMQRKLTKKVRRRAKASAKKRKMVIKSTSKNSNKVSVSVSQFFS